MGRGAAWKAEPTRRASDTRVVPAVGLRHPIIDECILKDEEVLFTTKFYVDEAKTAQYTAIYSATMKVSD